MDLLKLGAEMFIKNMGSQGSALDAGAVTSALSGLFGGGELNLGDIVSKLNGQGLASLVGSWLGDGQNAAISPAQIMSLFGEGAIGDFAAKLNVGSDAAAGGLAGMLPELLDKNSQGGSLLDAVGGAGGLLGMAKKLF